MEAIWFWDMKGTKEDQEQSFPSFCKIVPLSHGIKPNQQFNSHLSLGQHCGLLW